MTKYVELYNNTHTKTEHGKNNKDVEFSLTEQNSDKFLMTVAFCVGISEAVPHATLLFHA